MESTEKFKLIKQTNRILANKQIRLLVSSSIKEHYKLRKQLKTKRLECLERLNRAATVIQRHARGWIRRRKYDQLLVRSKQQLSSQSIQRLKRKASSIWKISCVAKESVDKLSKWYKSILFSRLVRRLQKAYQMLKYEREQKAKQTIKSFLVCSKTKIQVLEMKEEKRIKERLLKIKLNYARAIIKKQINARTIGIVIKNIKRYKYKHKYRRFEIQDESNSSVSSISSCNSVEKVVPKLELQNSQLQVSGYNFLNLFRNGKKESYLTPTHASVNRYKNTELVKENRNNLRKIIPLVSPNSNFLKSTRSSYKKNKHVVKQHKLNNSLCARHKGICAKLFNKGNSSRQSRPSSTYK